jgi:hypothetical protein
MVLSSRRSVMWASVRDHSVATKGLFASLALNNPRVRDISVGQATICGLRPRRKGNVHEINAYRGCNCGTRAWLSRVRAIAARCLLRSDLGVATDSAS